jgi:excisionase family DNA binding protein
VRSRRADHDTQIYLGSVGAQREPMPSAETTGHALDRPPDWLSIGPASRLLGVDVDTLRRWADEGRVEAFTTPGGHRRFSRRSVERLVSTRIGGGRRPLASLGATTDRVSAAYRRRYAAEHGPEGAIPGSVPSRQRAAFRHDGRRLVDALLRHLDATDPDARRAAEEEAGRIADDLGRRLARAGTSLTDAVALFVAARRPFLAELGAVARRRSLDAGRLTTIYDDASSVLDRLLLRFVARHQRTRV